MVNRARLYALTFLIFLPIWSWAQSTNAPLNEDYYHRIDRYEIKAGHTVNELFTTVKPYKRSAIAAMIDSLNKNDGVFSSASDRFNLSYLRNDNWEWSRSNTNDSPTPVLGQLYQKKSDLYYVDEPEFDLHINPVLYVGVGKDSQLGSSLFVNTRGVEVRGMIDKKIGFYTYLADNQARNPAYVADYSNVYGYYALPHQGFWKPFKSGGVDFFEARAYIDFNISKHIWVQFGNDRTNIGNGFRSLIFSDFSPASLFIRANAKIRKFNYFFQLSRMTAKVIGSANGSPGNSRYPDKFMAFHQLSVNLGKKFNIGLFESVIFAPQDSINGGVFELNYLNPVIFYRAIEQQHGSTDNVVLGLDWKWIAAKRLSFYGQVVLDEFVLKNLRAGNGWWANKFAIQGGLKYIDVAGINNLDLQLEGNVVRPFTYSHANQFTSYTNFMQPIAHPMGANFYEVAAIVRYQPMPRLHVTLKTFMVKTGRDAMLQTLNGTPYSSLLPGGPYWTNYGGDINKSYNSRIQDFNNKIGQGTDNTIVYGDLLVSYMVKHNLFIDFRQTIRNSKSPDPLFNYNSNISSVALRWNFATRSFDF